MLNPTTLALLLGAIIFIGLCITYYLYARIIKMRTHVEEALGNIDAQLQQRFDLLPNILKLAKRFMDHESTLFEEMHLIFQIIDTLNLPEKKHI
jgi:LemA protein